MMLRATRAPELKALPRRFIARFRFRSLLIAFAGLTVAVAWYSESWRQQAAAVAQLTRCAKFGYASRWPWPTYPEQRNSYGSPPQGIRKIASDACIWILGPHGAFEVDSVDLESDRLDEPAALGGLPTVTKLEVHATIGNGPRLAAILAHTPDVKKLCVSGALTFAPSDVRVIGRLRQIEEVDLDVADDEQCSQCLRETARFHDVCYLHVNCSRLSPEMVRSLATASAYECLTVWYEELPDMVFGQRLKSAQPNCQFRRLNRPMPDPVRYGLHVRFERHRPPFVRSDISPYDPFSPCYRRFPGHPCPFGRDDD